jgi:hypothetical protein
MKQLLILTIALSGIVHGQQRQFRDAATHDSLLPLFQKSQRETPVRKFTPSTGEDPTVTNVPGNLIERSDVISFNGNTTLIPKFAIIQIPASFKERINNHTPGNRIVTWGGFYSVNRGWITTVEVSRLQAEGKEPIAPEIVDVYSKSRNLVIATFNGAPISVLPPKEEENPIQTASKEETP